MSESASTFADKIDRAVQRVTPFAYRLRRRGRLWMRRAMRKPRSVSEGPNLLPLLIQVLASFSKADGVLLEEEIDSSLGFLRHDYPEAVYSELRMLFRQALYEQQDLSAMAQKLAASLSADRKIMLGVQLYDLISQAGLKQDQVVAFYSFMSQLGMAAQAIDIVYQLNASEDSDQQVYQRGDSPLEAISFGANGKSDVVLKSLSDNDRLLAFRYHDLILLKNYSTQAVSVRGRPLARGGFCRIYPGQRIMVGDYVLSFQDLANYFNAKKNVSLPQIFVRVSRDADDGGAGTLTLARKFARSDLRAEGTASRPCAMCGRSSTASGSMRTRKSRLRSMTGSFSTTTPNWIYSICGGGRAHLAAVSNSRHRSPNISSRITRACSKRTTFSFHPARPAMSF